ncbi:MAG: hypothetical protein JO186_01510 [Actinobacteria bacterium]|nr:hypothetical protein [Actinomycetota bacterium]
MTRLTTTEASRNFSALLGRAAAGERIEIMRSGTVVAVLSPPPHPRKKRFLSPDEFGELIRTLPPLDDDFLREIEEIRRSVGPPPTENPWES